LRQRDPRIPRDLETIVAKSIEKEPSRRYQSAAELAEDLKRFLDDRPIAARRTTTVDRSWRWCRRNPIVASLIGAVIAVTLCGMSGVIWQWQEALANARLARSRANQLAVKTQEAQQHALQAAAEGQKAKTERDATLVLNERLRRANYVAHMNLAQRAWHDLDVPRARELLDAHRPGQQTDLRGFEWHYLDRLCRQHLRQSTRLAAPLFKAAISPDRLRVAAATSASEVSVFDAATGQRIWGPAQVSATKVNKIAFSADGKRLAAVGGGTLKVFDAESGREVYVRPSHDDTWSVAMHTGGALAAVGIGTGVVNIYSLERREEAPRVLAGHTGAVDSLAFSPDGQYLASGSRDGNVIVRNAQTWEPLSFSPLKIDATSIWSVAFDPLSRELAAASQGGRIWSWDLGTGKPRFEQPASAGGTLLNVVFSPDGKQLAAGGWRQSIHLIDAQTGIELPNSPWRAQLGAVNALSFSPDSPRLISVGWDGVVRRWSTQSAVESIPFVEARKATALAVSRDGQYLATARQDSRIVLLDAKTGKELRELAGPAVRAAALAFSSDGKRLAGSFADGQVIVWDTANEVPPLTITMPPGDEAYRLAFSPDGSMLATGSLRRTPGAVMLRLWDARTGKLIRNLPDDPARTGHTSAVWALAFHPSGKRLASSSADGTVRMWDVATGEEQADFNVEDESGTSGLAFHPNGTQLACASLEGVVHIRDAQSGKALGVLAGHRSSVQCVAYSHDGRRMATGSADLTVRIWDTETSQELLSLAGHEELIAGVAFGAEDLQLFSYAFDGSLRLWDARPLP
jgi:WD40 repeat protein